MLRHPAQGAGRGRIKGRVYMMKVGFKDRGLVGPELCQLSPGLSRKVFFRFVNVGWRSVDEAIVGYCQ